MAYNYRLTLSKYRVLRKHKRAMLVLGLILFFVICIYLGFFWYIHQEDNLYKPQTDLKSEDFNPLKTFATPYFSFETDKSWKFIKEESSKNMFLYRSSKKNLIASDLTVYVNSLPDNLLLTHVLPVEPAGDRFIVGDVSDHCSQYLKDAIKPGDNNPVEGKVDSVRIKCQVDGTSNTVGTGEKNGSYQTALTGSSGKKAAYYLVYHDLEFMPQLDNFTNIVRSFRAK